MPRKKKALLTPNPPKARLLRRAERLVKLVTLDAPTIILLNEVHEIQALLKERRRISTPEDPEFIDRLLSLIFQSEQKAPPRIRKQK
jgi:hypothetical protein